MYEASYDPAHPVVCFDETPYQLIGEKRAALPMLPGKPQCYDVEYTRHGVGNVFMVFQLAAGRRHGYIRTHRKKEEFAQVMQNVLERQFPDTASLRVVMDNLNTHTPASFSEVFAPAEARRLASRLEIHYTPKHASW